MKTRVSFFNNWNFKVIFFSSFILLGIRCKNNNDFAAVIRDRLENEDTTEIKTLPKWEKGYLDIHQIVTGRGSSAFLKMPDGTTMIIDAGDLGTGSTIPHEIMPQIPDGNQSAGYWIVNYIKHFDPGIRAIDYALLTHYHMDHIGGPDDAAIATDSLPYKLSGITMVGNLLPITTLVDRGYNYPSREFIERNWIFSNYYAYVQDRNSKNLKTEEFKVGSNSQFALKLSPSEFSDFEIRNIHANDLIWDGQGNGSENIYGGMSASDVESANSYNKLENLSSCAIRLSYGSFTYFSGGDINGEGNPEWTDVEKPIGELIGKTDVVVADHHAYTGTMTSKFLQATNPKVVVIPAWDFYHPQPDVLSRMLDTRLYPGEKNIFSSGIMQSNLERLGADGNKIEGVGHIVVRVYQGGDKYQVFVLDESNTNYNIKYKTDTISSRN